MQFNSIRFKTSVLFALILFLILAVYSSVLYFTTHRILYHDVDEDLKVKAEEISSIMNAYMQLKQIEQQPIGFFSEILSSGQVGINKRAIIDELWHNQVKTLNLKNDYIHILNRKGQSIIVSENFKPNVEAVFKEKLMASFKESYYADLFIGKNAFRAVSLPVYYQNQPYIVIQVATSLKPIRHLLNGLIGFMFLSIFLILCITSFIGVFFVKRILTPVKNITEIANSISHKDLHVRIEKKHVDQEMKYLIDSLNTMLERLEKSFEHISEFSSHVAHELKTPLAIVRGEIELALNEERDPQEYKRVLHVSLEEVDRLIRIIKDLLLLAKLDYKPDIFKFEQMNLVALLKEIYEHSKILALEKKIKVSLEADEESLFIQGDQVHLRRLFLNLIHNAVKFTPANREVSIRIKRSDKQVFVSIEDQGIGISEEDQKKIFTKFFRVHKSEHGIEPGNGLGLSIAQSIAKAHGGEITFISELNKGTTFTVALPLKN